MWELHKGIGVIALQLPVFTSHDIVGEDLPLPSSFNKSKMKMLFMLAVDRPHPSCCSNAGATALMQKVQFLKLVTARVTMKASLPWQPFVIKTSKGARRDARRGWDH
eukprot:scaffold226972_cov35-Prasinocladus_malaysianus.AAC.1